MNVSYSNCQNPNKGKKNHNNDSNDRCNSFSGAPSPEFKADKSSGNQKFPAPRRSKESIRIQKSKYQDRELSSPYHSVQRRYSQNLLLYGRQQSSNQIELEDSDNGSPPMECCSKMKNDDILENNIVHTSEKVKDRNDYHTLDHNIISNQNVSEKINNRNDNNTIDNTHQHLSDGIDSHTKVYISSSQDTANNFHSSAGSQQNGDRGVDSHTKVYISSTNNYHTSTGSQENYDRSLDPTKNESDTGQLPDSDTGFDHSNPRTGDMHDTTGSLAVEIQAPSSMFNLIDGSEQEHHHKNTLSTVPFLRHSIKKKSRMSEECGQRTYEESFRNDNPIVGPSQKLKIADPSMDDGRSFRNDDPIVTRPSQKLKIDDPSMDHGRITISDVCDKLPGTVSEFDNVVPRKPNTVRWTTKMHESIEFDGPEEECDLKKETKQLERTGSKTSLSSRKPVASTSAKTLFQKSMTFSHLPPLRGQSSVHSDDDDNKIEAIHNHTNAPVNELLKKLSIANTKWFNSTHASDEPSTEYDGNIREQIAARAGRGETLSWRDRIIFLVDSVFFESLMGFIILLNCVTIGMETKPQTFGPLLEIFEHIFTAIFLLEVIARIYVFGRQYFRNWWNMFDLALVLITGVLIVWIIKPVAGEQHGFLRHMQLLRACRLMRIARVVRMMPMFKEMWLLLRGLKDSLRTLFWTSAVILFVIYIFSIFSHSIMHQNIIHKRCEVPEDSQIYTDFGDLPNIIFTLARIMTLDNWSTTVSEVTACEPMMGVFFFLFMAISVFVLLNLVTAVIVDNALEISRQDEEQMIRENDLDKRHELVKLQMLFDDLDLDQDGELTRDEFDQAFQLPRIKRKIRLLDFEETDLDDLFSILDDDESGKVTVEEFCYGLSQLKGPAKAKDLLVMIRGISKLICRVEDIHAKQVNHDYRFDYIEDMLEYLCTGTYTRRAHDHKEYHHKPYHKHMNDRGHQPGDPTGQALGEPHQKHMKATGHQPGDPTVLAAKESSIGKGKSASRYSIMKGTAAKNFDDLKGRKGGQNDSKNEVAISNLDHDSRSPSDDMLLN